MTVTIARAAEALKDANRARIHTFIATSALHMEKKVAHDARACAGAGAPIRALCAQLIARHRVQPGGRLPQRPDFLLPRHRAVIAEGATTINVPDTVGYAIPELYGAFIKNLRERVPNSDKAVWSVHCHKRPGMAVANSLAGVKLGGARQIELHHQWPG